MDRKTKIPVTRMNMWFTDADFDFDMDVAKEFLENDANFRVVLFRVDRVNTQYDDVYGESETNEIRFLPPVELVVSKLTISESELKNYVPNGSLTYMDRGNISFSVLNTMLKDKDVDIRRGDFVGYNFDEAMLNYYTVVNDGRNDMASKHTLYGTRQYSRTIVCTPVDPNQFNAL